LPYNATEISSIIKNGYKKSTIKSYLEEITDKYGALRMEKDTKGRFTEGNSGKPKGAVNKTSNKIREAFQKLIEDNLENMTIWLTQVAADDPKSALDIMTKLGEYTTPKLARVENKHEVDEGITEIQLNFVKPKD
jgi:hypothetical protein